MGVEYKGRLWQQYVFIPEENKIVLQYQGGTGQGSPDFGGAGRGALNDAAKLLLITNVSTQEIIYSPQIPGKGFAAGTGTPPGTVILEYDCTSMNKRDVLQIFVEIDYIDLESMRSIAEARAQQTQVGILKTLLKIEKQLEIITDEQVLEADIVGPGLKRK